MTYGRAESIEEISSLCNRVLFIKDGNVIKDLEMIKIEPI